MGDGTAIDAIGTNHGTLMNGATASTQGLVGQAFNFDGVDDYLYVQDTASLRPSSITVEAWVKAVSPGSYKYLLAKSYNPGFASYALYSGGSGGLSFYVTAGGSWFASPDAGSTIWDGQFHHVAGTYDGSAVRLYVDGIQIGSGSPASSPISYGTSFQNGDLLVAAFQYGGSYAFPGQVDELSIYNRGLNSNEIAAIYAAGSAGKCSSGPPNIVLQPVSQFVSVASPASFAVGATGSRPFSYQWQHQSTNLPLATDATLSLTGVGMNDAGNYQVIVTNQFGAATSAVAVLTVVPAGSVAYWDGGGDGTSWSDARNWSNDQIPTATNDVVINVTNGNPTITLNGSVTIRSLQCEEDFLLAGGSLTVTVGASQLNGAFTMTNGASVSANGSGTTFTCNGPMSADSASLYANAGAVVTLPNLRTYAKPVCNHAYWQASGPGSRLVFPALQTLDPSEGCGYQFYVQALDGGSVVMTAVTNIAEGTINLLADGTNSLIDLTALVSFHGNIRGGTSEARNGGEIRLPQLLIATRMVFTFHTNATMLLPSLTNIDSSSFYVSAGAVVTLPSLRAYAKPVCAHAIWQASGPGSRLVFPVLQTLDPSEGCGYQFYVQALDGGSVVMTAVPNIAEGTINLLADGTNSLIDLSALVSFRGNIRGGTSEARNGGEIRLPQLLTATRMVFTFQTNATMLLPSLTDLDNGSLYVNAGAVVTLPNLRTYAKPVCNHAYWQASGPGSRLVFPALQTLDPSDPCGYQFYVQALDGGSVELPAVTNIIEGTINLLADGNNSLIDLSALITFHGNNRGGTSEARNGGEIRLPQLLTATRMVFTFQTNATMLLPSLTDLDNGSLYVNAGAVVTLPNLRTYAKPVCNHAYWQASGPGSRLVLPALQTLDPADLCGSYELFVQALDGGAVVLANLATIGNGRMQVWADGLGSVVNLLGLKVAPLNSGSFTLLETAGGQILMPSPVDFVVTGITPPGTAFAGQAVQLSWTVRNQGTNSAIGPRSDAVWLSTNGIVTGSAFLGHYPTATALAPGEEQTVTNMVVLPVGMTGSLYFIVTADSLYQFYEAGAKANNTLVATNVIIVTNLPPPTITCPGPVVTNAASGQCYATGVNLGTPAATGTGIHVGNNAPAQFPVGTTVVTWTVTDVINQTATCPQLVTVTAPGPQPGNHAVGTMANTPQTMPVFKMLANDTHPLGKAMQLTGVAASGLGSAVAVSTNNGEVIITYTPPPDYIGSDSFTYTNTDSCGVSAVGTVAVTVTASGSFFNLVSIDSASVGANTVVTVVARGIPGGSYALQHAAALSASAAWGDLQTRTAGSSGTNFGVVVFTLTNPPSPSYYRTRTP